MHAWGSLFFCFIICISCFSPKLYTPFLFLILFLTTQHYSLLIGLFKACIVKFRVPERVSFSHICIFIMAFCSEKVGFLFLWHSVVDGNNPSVLPYLYNREPWEGPSSVLVRVPTHNFVHRIDLICFVPLKFPRHVFENINNKMS